MNMMPQWISTKKNITYFKATLIGTSILLGILHAPTTLKDENEIYRNVCNELPRYIVPIGYVWFLAGTVITFSFFFGRKSKSPWFDWVLLYALFQSLFYLSDGLTGLGISILQDKASMLATMELAVSCGTLSELFIICRFLFKYMPPTKSPEISVPSYRRNDAEKPALPFVPKK